MADAIRVEIGFDGGQVVAARLDEQSLERLRSNLRGTGWYDLESEDGTLVIALEKVAFLRIDSTEHRVGFSGS